MPPPSGWRPGVGKKVLAPLISIAGTVIGSMVGMPYLGSALGGAISGGVSGGNLKSALLGGITGAAGTGLGNVVSKGLAGLGGLAGSSGTGSLLGGIGADTLSDAVSPLVVNAAKGGLGSALGNVGAGQLVGSGLGSVVGQALSGNGGTKDPTGTEVDPITVTAGQGGGLGDLGGLTPITGFQDDTMIPSPNVPKVPIDGQSQPAEGNGFINDLVGNTLGGVAAGNLTNSLAGLLGLGPKPPSTVYGGGDMGDGGGLGGGTTPTTPTAPVPGGPTTGTAPTPGAGLGSGAGAAPLLTTGGTGAGVAGTVSAPSEIAVQGSMAPDIYPWRRVA